MSLEDFLGGAASTVESAAKAYIEIWKNVQLDKLSGKDSMIDQLRGNIALANASARTQEALLDAALAKQKANNIDFKAMLPWALGAAGLFVVYKLVR